MKNALFILAGATALSLASCSQEKTADTTTTTVPADGAVTTTTTTDETYKARGNRMADKFASDMKIADEPTKEKLRTAYYNRSKRYDAMHQKYMSDTTGMAADMRQYNTDTDQEFQGILTQPAQYQSYQSSRSTYDEANNLDTNGQTAGASSATMPSDSSGSMSSSGSDNMSSGSTPTTASSVMRNQDMLNSDNKVAKSKTKLENGAKVKVKGDEVKIKTADGEKTKM
ncbi:hypothetical protein E4631_05220 [Hymenobacter sp. UV11]|uniref:hypothetical protein n=1 Tax=Hymenobacter sp. UV11 TaxID=1849735 RepID=UPI00105F5FDC|nr:hypothetical protein [Hymenobacter sp. UV11]TDN35784.1 hypothetical protein A8B98_12070 [Hymenobacter sp. UV11]TFZ67388.1 hypothetical protein E4631_05220 [Hymenobacter sp. UV11]